MKNKTTFTAKGIQALKPKEKDYTLSEGQGFTIRVLPSGVKTWWYYYSFAGKRRKLNLGNFPHVALELARKEFRNAANLVTDGIDPQISPSAPVTEAPLTLEILASQWTAWSAEQHDPKWANTLKLAIAKDFLPIYGSRLASELRRREAVAILEAKAVTAPGQARNLHKALRGMFAYAVDRELVDSNPFAEIRAARVIPTMKPTSRERHLSDDEIKIIWNAIDSGGGSDSTRRVLKLTLLTGQRPGEVAGMHSREIQIGVGQERCNDCRRCGWWTIPAERRKDNKGGEHRVYLTPFAMSLVSDWEALDGYIFPGVDLEKPITENSVAYHVRRDVPATEKIPYYGLPRWTPHDLRRTCGTGIVRLGGRMEIMDAILGHQIVGVAGVYNRHKYDAEKLEWSTIWAEHLQRQLGI